MAEIDYEGDELVVRLTTLERAEALHGDVRVPAADVEEIAVVHHAMRAVRGLRAPGTGFPGKIAVGTFRGRGSKQFAVVHHDTPDGVRIRLAGRGRGAFTELIVGCAEPAAVAARLRAGHGRSGADPAPPRPASR